MEEFPSGQRGQTVNLLSTTSVVRIHPPPPARRKRHIACDEFFYFIAKLIAYSFCCSSLPNHNRRAGLRFGLDADLWPGQAGTVWLKYRCMPAQAFSLPLFLRSTPWREWPVCRGKRGRRPPVCALHVHRLLFAVGQQLFFRVGDYLDGGSLSQEARAVFQTRMRVGNGADLLRAAAFFALVSPNGDMRSKKRGWQK